MREYHSASPLKALIELFDSEWTQFSIHSFGFWRNRGWNGAVSGFELNYYTRGENTVVQDKRTVSFKQGDLFLVSDSIRHSFCSDGSFDLYYLMFHFDRPELNSRMRSLFSQSKLETEPLSVPSLQSDLHTLITELRMNRQTSVMAKHYFLHIFVKIHTVLMQSAGQRNKHERIVRQVIEDIQERLDSGLKILLPEVAARHSLNERYLNHIFKTITGTTLGQYILTFRIEWAKRLLETTSMLVTEIAIVTGFFDGAHFSKAFKASQAISPLDYRMRHAFLPVDPESEPQ
ncbi:helix-turn-helix domain-containing protein [Paenibacillus alkaliterrae]|uniref:helix-turn-helix domain-containing protein n=1 Tax=Paenibacillus alkaliterrae TaxID=320909 RepID=UPI001F2D85F5|nr:helix-turn-helix domain-containing protein [Paenibacillus alkaliterrae]MCF2937831.1 helix-turn-helix domain-containing protein [Paenibacillus alkaliterrae]